MMMISNFAKFVVKRIHQNALHATLICAPIACMSILVILMLLSSHSFISVCHMVVACGKEMWKHSIIQFCFNLVNICFPHGGWS